MLDEAHDRRAYRLAASVISLGHAMRIGSPVLNTIGPLMRAESVRRKVNVRLATVDRTMMVYLESIRYSPRVALRNVVAGQQVPMELTSLGRAYLAGLCEAERAVLMRQFRRRTAAATRLLLDEVSASIRSVERRGYCAVSWQRGVLAVAAPLVIEGLPVYALNLSVQDVEPSEAFAGELAAYLLAFLSKCREELSARSL